MKDTAPVSAFGHEYALASAQRDFVEWRKERTHYAVWAIDVDTPALRAATAAMRAHLADNLLDGYRRQPHVTLHLCGFPSASPRCNDDYPGAALQRQIAALQAAGPAPFTLEIGSPASFAPIRRAGRRKTGKSNNAPTVICHDSANIAINASSRVTVLLMMPAKVSLNVRCAPMTSLLRRLTRAPVRVRLKNAIGMVCTWS